MCYENCEKIEKKIEFFKFSKFCNFFPKIFGNFFRIFALAIIYRKFWHRAQKIRHDLLFLKMTSNQNLNGRSLTKISNFYWKGPDLLPAFRIQFSLTPYYSSSRGWDILLYESLRSVSAYAACAAKKLLKKIENFDFSKFLKFVIFLKFCWIFFFWLAR